MQPKFWEKNPCFFLAKAGNTVKKAKNGRMLWPAVLGARMVFSSLLFLFGFLPLTLAAYYLLPRRARNPVLFFASLLFYAYGEPVYLFLMLLSITTAFCFGLRIEKYLLVNPKKAKRTAIASILVTLSFLFFFKYYNFFAGMISALPGITLSPIAGLMLPIGISFYTFQILSYTVDLWRGECAVQRNYLLFGTYVTLFPQLIAGPIVRYREIDRQLTERKETVEGFAAGAIRFCAGLAKKMLLGDLLASGYEYYQTLLALHPTVDAAWLAAILFSLHLYFDFSGYTDMALGLGKMFGFDFPENFHYPYCATSITDFWRRWHISLSSWFKEYVYIPLGGNKKGKLTTLRNLLIVWLLTGFWHGAGWNFILWGLYYGVLLILEKLFLSRLLEKLPRLFRHLYTILLTLFGFLLFSSSGFIEAGNWFSALFGIGTVGLSSTLSSYQFLHMLPLLAIACLGATPLPRRVTTRLFAAHPKLSFLAPAVCLIALFLSSAYLVDSSYSPFAYFNF